jgi:glycerol uptake facilitator-like aquaporin
VISRCLVAETLGTALLLTAIVGSGIMAESLTRDTALALLCNSLATGAALVVLITVFGPLSGAHLNPAVTMVFRLRNNISTGTAVAYIGCQLAGAVLGTWAAHLMFGQPVFQLSSHLREGAPLWFAEGVATFGLVLTILGSLRWKPEALPLTVGLYITSAYWFTASTSFANPAVTIARSLTGTFAGIHPADAPPFIVAQFVGAVGAFIVCAWLFNPARTLSDTRTAGTSHKAKCGDAAVYKTPPPLV